MSNRRFFDHDPLTGTTQWFESTDDGGFSIISEADVEPIIEANKAKQAMGRAFYASDPDMWKVGSIPNMVLLQWATELGIPAHKIFSDEMADVWARRLASSEFRHLKTADVRI
jgi:hypothetical protein